MARHLDHLAEDGAAAIEYGVVTALFGLVSIAVIRLLGTQLGDMFNAIAKSVTG